MDKDNFPQCSNAQKANQVEVREENENVTNNTPKPSTILASEILSHSSILSRLQERPLIIQASSITPITTQPRCYSNLQSQQSMFESNRPLPLFFQALSKLNENSLNIVGLTQNKASPHTLNKYIDVTPPDSLGNAPPSYSFVLRQMAARRRPRLMGTFIPSPSFVQHTPPPNYATAFDIYVDPVTPRAPTRVYALGFTSSPYVCPECGFVGMTVITSRVTICTHMCAFVLCLFCCWICAPLPYMLKSCKDVYHHCRNCRNYLGMYSPTNPNSAYMNV